MLLPQLCRLLLLPLLGLPAIHCVQLQTDFDGDGISDDMELRLARTFAPVVHFHHLEMFYAAAVEPFLAEARVYYQRSPEAPHCLFTTHEEYATLTLPVLTVSPEEYEVCTDLQPRPRLRKSRTAPEDVYECNWNSLRCDLYNHTDVHHNVIQCTSLETRVDQFFFMHIGRAIRSAFNASTPVYVHVHPLEPDETVVQYWFFYPFNGPLDDMLSAGAHEGDWEHLSVVLDKTRSNVTRVYMAAHSHEASWLTRDQVRFTPGAEQVHTYVALHTHAMYPSAGVKKRIDGNILYSFLHDHCSDDGIEWRPAVFVNMGETERPLVPWAYFNGYWGSKKMIYSFIPLPFDSASPPKGPMHQRDYWKHN